MVGADGIEPPTFALYGAPGCTAPALRLPYRHALASRLFAVRLRLYAVQRV